MQNLKPFLTIFALVCALFSVSCVKSWFIIPHPNAAAFSSNLMPNQGPDSTLVTITGSGFDSTGIHDSIYFNGKQAAVVSATDTSLIVRVPTLAGTGEVIGTIYGKTTDIGLFTYDTTWRVTKVIDSISDPMYVSLDASGDLYVGPYGDDRLDKITPAGVVSTFATLYATGNAVDAYNNVYVVAEGGAVTQIEKITPSGSIFVVGTDTGFIAGLALDTAGNIYLGNTTNGSVDKIDKYGVRSIVDTGLFNVSGVTVDPSGNIYAINYSIPSYTNSAGVITKITPSGDTSTFAHVLYSGWGGMTFGTDGNLYVSNFNQEWALGDILRISPSGVETPLVSTNLMFPCGVARDASGNLYVAQQADAPGSSFGSVVKLTMH